MQCHATELLRPPESYRVVKARLVRLKQVQS